MRVKNIPENADVAAEPSEYGSILVYMISQN
jgi:hypothetical protein